MAAGERPAADALESLVVPKSAPSVAEAAQIFCASLPLDSAVPVEGSASGGNQSIMSLWHSVC